MTDLFVSISKSWYDASSNNSSTFRGDARDHLLFPWLARLSGSVHIQLVFVILIYHNWKCWDLIVPIVTKVPGLRVSHRTPPARQERYTFTLNGRSEIVRWMNARPSEQLRDFKLLSCITGRLSFPDSPLSAQHLRLWLYFGGKDMRSRPHSRTYSEKSIECGETFD